MVETIFETQSNQHNEINLGIDLDGDPFSPIRPRVLIVDDDQSTVALLKLVLARAGYDVAGASSGHEAIQKSSIIKPHAILLDLMMPEMDGFETFGK